MKLVQQTTNFYLTEHPPSIFPVRGALLLGRERAVVWDTLLHPNNMTEVARLCRDRSTTVVYSHADWDHIWGTAGLEYAEIVGHESCKERFDDPDDVRAALEAKIAQDERYRAVMLVAPTRTFREQLTLELGDLTLELYHLPGHTRDCIVGFIPELGVLLGGDAVEHPLPLVYAHSGLGGWLAGLERWANDERVHCVIPCHGQIGGRECLGANIAYLRALHAGQLPDVPSDLAPFYREAHTKNLQRAVTGS